VLAADAQQSGIAHNSYSASSRARSNVPGPGIHELGVGSRMQLASTSCPTPHAPSTALSHRTADQQRLGTLGRVSGPSDAASCRNASDAPQWRSLPRHRCLTTENDAAIEIPLTKISTSGLRCGVDPRLPLLNWNAEQKKPKTTQPVSSERERLASAPIAHSCDGCGFGSLRAPDRALRLYDTLRPRILTAARHRDLDAVLLVGFLRWAPAMSALPGDVRLEAHFPHRRLARDPPLRAQDRRHPGRASTAGLRSSKAPSPKRCDWPSSSRLPQHNSTTSMSSGVARITATVALQASFNTSLPVRSTFRELRRRRHLATDVSR